MNTLRTIQVVNVRWHNATAWYGLELARLLNNAGHETRVLGLADTESFARAESLGLNPIALPLNTCNPLELASLTRRLSNLLTAFRPHIVNCHRGESFFLWGLLKAAHNFRLIRTRGDQRLPRNTLPNRLLHQRAADALIATNTRMARHFADALHVDPSRIHTIYGGVDTAHFAFDPFGRERIRSLYNYAPTDRVVGLLGRFDEVKGQRELIAAVAPLIRDNLPVHLLLLGFATATSQQTVERWIAEAGLGHRVRITGKVDDVAAHLSALDIGVVASLWSETIARAALEIMAVRRPLLSTSVGVMPDLLVPEALCPPADVPALAALIRRAVASPAWAHSLVETQDVLMKGLDQESFLGQTLDVYYRA